jgi:hypothetical protein
VKTNDKLSTIIRDNEKEAGLLADKIISGDGHVVKKQAEYHYNTQP